MSGGVTPISNIGSRGSAAQSSLHARCRTRTCGGRQIYFRGGIEQRWAIGHAVLDPWTRGVRKLPLFLPPCAPTLGHHPFDSLRPVQFLERSGRFLMTAAAYSDRRGIFLLELQVGCRSWPIQHTPFVRSKDDLPLKRLSFGSKADMAAMSDVRLTSESGHWLSAFECSLSPKMCDQAIWTPEGTAR